MACAKQGDKTPKRLLPVSSAGLRNAARPLFFLMVLALSNSAPAQSPPPVPPKPLVKKPAIPVPNLKPKAPGDTKIPDPKAAPGKNSPPTKRAIPAPPPPRWTAPLPDLMLDQAVARARRLEDDTLAALLVAASLDERVSFRRARDGLRSLSYLSGPYGDEARMLFLRLTPETPTPPWPGAQAISYDSPPDSNGLVKSYAILGPFQDTGGGLFRREGPEAPGQSFSDTKARYSWGVYDVGFRRTLPASSTARGLPLDLYIHPRQETCTYLASRVTVPKAPPVRTPNPAPKPAPVKPGDKKAADLKKAPAVKVATPSKPTMAALAAKGVDTTNETRAFLIHVASTGAVRLMWDGADIASSEEIHTEAILDRMAVRLEATPGDHWIGLKVCSGALPDEGRVRVRFTDENRRPLAMATSSDLRGIAKAAASVPDEKTAKAKGIAPKAKGAPGKTVPKMAERVLTPMEKALAIGDSPSPEQALSSSIVRTLGGADDARSPKAPGLLDRVAKTQGISADMLAMTGWISPFGANRSGWLNQAYQRAKTEKDGQTAAFTQRRLAASNLNSGMIDWAQSAIQEEPLKSAGDPEARLIRAMVKHRLGGAGFARAAVDELLALTEEMKTRTPVSVWDELANAARSQPSVWQKAMIKLAEMRPDARGAAFVSAHRGIDGSAMELAAARCLMQQTDADDLVRIGRDLFEAGRYPWAREVFYWATRVSPNLAPAFEGLADARRAARAVDKSLDTALAARESALATDALSRARDLEPGDPFHKAELSFRTGADEGDGEGPEPAAAPGVNANANAKMRDEQYLPAPDVFMAKARAKPAVKGEISDRQLHWVRVVTYHPDKRVSQLMHYAREIVIEPRTEADLYEPNVPSEGDETELLFARLYKRDGTVVMPEEQSSGGRVPMVRWPELKTGDVVEVATRSWTAQPVGRRGDAPYYFIDYVGSIDTHPILYNEVVIDSPEVSPLAIDVLNGKPDRMTNETKEGRRIQRFIWDNPPNIPDEPLAPQGSEVLPVVVGSTFASWHDFREWYRGAVQGFTEPDDQVKRLAADLTKGKKTRDEKIKAVFNFVADDIRYLNYVSGEWWLPNRPQQLLARRQGDCDDKAILLISLLKSLGIEATEVLVQTRYTAQPGLLKSDKAAIAMFDHGIAYLPGKNGESGMWLDATSPQSRLGPLPAMDSRAVALFVNDGPAKIIETPASSPADHGVDAEWTIQLTATGAGELTAKERHSGDAAFELRNNLGQADARAQWVEQYLSAGWFPAVQVKPAVTFNGELGNGTAELSYQASSEGFARREGNELSVPLTSGSTYTSALAPLLTRTLPVVLPPLLAPGHQTHTITIVAPPGYEFAELPPGGEEPAGEFGSARVEFRREKTSDRIVVLRNVVFDMSTIPVAKYPAWRAWLSRVDGLVHRMPRLVQTSSSKTP